MAADTDVDNTIRRGAPVFDRIVAVWREWLNRVRENYRVSLYPRTAVEARVVHEQLAMVRESTKSTVIVLPFIGALVAFYNHQVLPWSNMLVWWGALTVICVGGEIVGKRIREANSDVTPAAVSRVAWLFTGLTVVVTLVWASMVFALWVPGDRLDHIVLVLLLCASLSSSSSVNAPHFASSRVSLWIYGGIALIGPVVMGDKFDFTMASMTLAFVFSMSAQMRANFETTRKMLSLQDERSGMITNLRAAKTESDVARDRAEKASRAKSQFLANMSHELRTPMNAILGFSEMIQSNVAMTTEKNGEYAQIINQSGQHLLGLINDILDLAKIESGTMQLRETRVALPSLIADCERLMSAKARTGELNLHVETAALPDVLADERALRQILINLLANAVKFTPPGGDVCVFAKMQADGAVCIGVRDTGVGIAAEDQKRVFENFGQGRHDVVTIDKGTGLGLPIVKGLTEAHGGRVELKSAVGSGTCVTVVLPVSRVLAVPTKIAS